MSGNVALDVVIGITFIYLLYSLYATIIMEIISSTLGLRARNLRYTLRRMLMDERRYDAHSIKINGEVRTVTAPYLAFFFNAIARFITSFLSMAGFAINLKNNALFKRFFMHPSIKYTSGGGLNNKPSYLSAENFCKALIDTIKVNDPDLSVLSSIQIGLERREILPVNSETRVLLLSFLQDANNDLAKFNILVEQWFNDTMERSIGWFKRTTQFFLMIVGFVLVISFNVDTIAIIKKLSKDKAAREQLAKFATDFMDKNASAIEALKNKSDSAIAGDLKKQLDSLQAIRNSLKADVQNAQNVLGTDWNVPDSVRYFNKPRHVGEDSVKDKSKKDSVQFKHTNDSIEIEHKKDLIEIEHKLKNGSSVFVMVPKSIAVKEFKNALPKELGSSKTWLKVNTACYKTLYVWDLDRFWGYLLTVLAISLGAPFWFDLLNKLVKLRTSKMEPVDSDQKATGKTDTNSATKKRAG